MKIIMVPAPHLGRVNLAFLHIFIWMTIEDRSIDYFIIISYHFYLKHQMLIGPLCQEKGYYTSQEG